MLTPADKARLEEFTHDPGTEFPLIVAGFRRRQRALSHELISITPTSETAYARMHAAHTLFLELEKLCNPDGFMAWMEME
jgi:predicted component of type VI protein secretion system